MTIFREFVYKIQVPLKSEKNFTRRPMEIYDISLNIS